MIKINHSLLNTNFHLFITIILLIIIIITINYLKKTDSTNYNNNYYYFFYSQNYRVLILIRLIKCIHFYYYCELNKFRSTFKISKNKLFK